MSKIHLPPYIPPTADSQLPFTAASSLQILCTGLMGTLSLILLLIFGITKKHQKTFFNHVFANLIILSLFCSAIARPATILSTILYDFDPSYCTAYVFVLELETVGVPLAVLALIVERTVYFSCLPLLAALENYKQKLSHAWKVLLVALPWIPGILFACVKTFGLLQPIVHFGDVQRGLNDTHRYYSCHLEGWSQEAEYAAESLLYSVRSGMPLVYLCVGIVVMLVYWCKVESLVNPQMEDVVDGKMRGKCTTVLRMVGLVWRMMKSCVGTNRPVLRTKESQSQILTSQNNQESIPNGSRCQSVDSAIEDSVDGNDTHDQPLLEPAKKTNATVLTVIPLALTCACVVVGGSIMVEFHGWLYESTQWLYFGLEFTAVLLAYCFPEVQQTLCGRRCTSGDQDSSDLEMKQPEMTNDCLSSDGIVMAERESSDVGSSMLKYDGDQDSTEKEIKQEETSNHSSSGYSTTRDAESLEITI